MRVRPFKTAATVLLFVLVSVSVPAGEPAPRPEVDLGTLLHEMVSLEHLSRFPSPAYVARQASSYDRASKDPRDAETWFANADRGHYLRVEERAGRREYVLLDAEGPGVVTRIWSANPQGTLRIYIDDVEEPALEAPMDRLLRGEVKPFDAPIAYEASRGCNIYFPFAYTRRCRITSDKGDFYYQVGYRTYERGTLVKPYSAAAVREVRDALDGVRTVLAAPAKSYRPSARQSRTIVALALAAPGATARVGLAASSRGGEAIRELALRPSRTDADVLRRTVLTLRFDEKETVRVPLGDFFGSAPGLNPYASLPLSVSADGTLTCRWVMPFQRSAVLELRGPPESDLRVEGHILSEPYVWDSECLYFHADWRSTHDMPTVPPRDWNYASITGRGLYAGNVLSVANPVRAWWGEGDEKIYVDGETFPSHFGTGTEDYYGYAWCCPEPFNRAYHSQTRCDGPGNFGYTSINRWHILDAIPFAESFRFDMEVWHWDRAIEVSYDSVSFWYGGADATSATTPIDPVALRVPALPEMKVKVIPGALEGEAMRVVSATGTAEPQNLAGFGSELWSRDAHLWWRGAKPGDRLVLDFPAPAAGAYRITAYLTKAPDYGIHQLRVDGEMAGEPVDLYARSVVPREPLLLGTFRLQEKGNRLEVVITGTNARARPKNYMFGLDCIVLEPVGE